MAVHSHVHAQTLRFEIAVGVAVEVPTSVMTSRPHTQRIVAHDDEILVDLDVIDVRRALRPHPGVVTAEEKDMLAIEFLDISFSRFLPRSTESEIAGMHNSILLSYDRIMSADQLGVHLFDGIKRTVAVFKDLPVSVMFVSSKEVHSMLTLYTLNFLLFGVQSNSRVINESPRMMIFPQKLEI